MIHCVQVLASRTVLLVPERSVTTATMMDLKVTGASALERARCYKLAGSRTDAIYIVPSEDSFRAPGTSV